MESLEIQIRYTNTVDKLKGIKSTTPTRPIIHDFKKMREERYLNRNLTPRSEINQKIDALGQINSIQEELRHTKIPENRKTPELKLIYSKDSRPKSAFRGHEENPELIKIAENIANLFVGKRGASGRADSASRKKLSLGDFEELAKGSTSHRAAPNKVPKPVLKSTGLLRKYLKK